MKKQVGLKLKAKRFKTEIRLNFQQTNFLNALRQTSVCKKTKRHYLLQKTWHRRALQPGRREKRVDYLLLPWVTRGFPAERKEIKHGLRNMTVAWPGKEYAFRLRWHDQGNEKVPSKAGSYFYLSVDHAEVKPRYFFSDTMRVKTASADT